MRLERVAHALAQSQEELLKYAQILLLLYKASTRVLLRFDNLYSIYKNSIPSFLCV